MVKDELTLEERYGGLIFDCDGTLVDTAPIHFLAVRGAMQSLGLTIGEEWYFARTGLTPAALFQAFEAEYGVPIDAGEISRRYGSIFLDHIGMAKEVTAVAAVARKNVGRVPMAVASNGHLKNVEATLRATGLFDLFDCVVSADQVAQGKPAPDVFLEAARRLGVKPSDCIVFEDTDEGLEAAARAGMRVKDVRLAINSARCG